MKQLMEIERAKERHAAAQKELQELMQRTKALTKACTEVSLSNEELSKVLSKAVPMNEHCKILHSMSNEYMESVRHTELREQATEVEHKSSYADTEKVLRHTLLESDTKLAEFEKMGNELQNANARHRAEELRSARLAEQLRQLASVQPLIEQRQSQLEAVQARTLDYWKQLQGKLWEAERLRGECAVRRARWHALAGEAAHAAASGSVDKAGVVGSSPAMGRATLPHERAVASNEQLGMSTSFEQERRQGTDKTSPRDLLPVTERAIVGRQCPLDEPGLRASASADTIGMTSAGAIAAAVPALPTTSLQGLCPAPPSGHLLTHGMPWEPALLPGTSSGHQQQAAVRWTASSALLISPRCALSSSCSLTSLRAS